jgi:tRNA threonylcarbamoyladenosine biosynthesis protein TsaB
MNILAVDTVTPILSVTAHGKAGVVTITIASLVQHAEHLVDAIESAISLAGFTPKETELVAVPEGPGSFTGLRIAYSAAKAIQLAASCPLYPVPTLDCYADGSENFKGLVVSVLDAKKGRFYVRLFRSGSPVTESLDLHASALRAYLDPEEKILVTGPDAILFAEEFTGLNPDISCTIETTGNNGISSVLAEFAKSGRTFYTQRIPDHAGPVYVRKSDAESGLSDA